ncbi:DNA polymerase I [Aureivirga marina]|uniref:DNA polymerase I n=1 Tax=Aureivirga marina TaxID=1182451 RepID=UPI001E4B54E0|nr:DNA polymerase I [Aureivirga marina]
MEQKRLFLLDAYALIFRGYYAFIKNPRINSKGLDTSAILGFTNSLFEIIRKEKPDHLAVAFDKGGSVARTEAFEAYKSNRQETPEAIKIAVPYIHKILEAMHIPIIEKEGFEADDLIGTLAKQAEKQGYKTYMVTPDKDFAQLVSENIFMYRPARMGNGIEIWGIPEVQAKFEVESPLQVIDYLGMMGDAVDNIPGLPGVGDKTAKKFIKQYGSMENLLANTHELKGKMKEKVEANKELGILSKKLATIMLDCPVEFHEENFEMCKPDLEKSVAIFEDLEFRRNITMLQNIYGATNVQAKTNQENPKKEAPKNTSGTSDQLDLFSMNTMSETETVIPSKYKNIEDTDNLYQYINTETALRFLISKLEKQTEVSIVLEKNTKTGNPAGIAFSYEKGKSYYVELQTKNSNEILEQLKPFFEDEKILKIGFDLKEVIKVLHDFDISVKGNIFDITVAHYLLHPDMRHSLDILSEAYLEYKTIEKESLLGKGKKQITLHEIALEKQTSLVAEQADVTFQLKEIFKKKLEENKLTQLFETIEMPLLSVLAKMEIEGIRLDTNSLSELSKTLEKDSSELADKIYKEAGEEFNIASPKQLGVILFEKMKLLAKPKKTKTGQYATSEDILSKLAKDFPIVQDILDWRSLVKLKNTYVDSLPKEINPKTGKIHTTYSQTVAATGRLSSNNPNLQNIPIRTEQGRQIRKAFVPRNEDYILVAADYSQIELRLIADMSKDPTMIASFNHNEDIHRSTAAKVFKIPLEEVTREQRSYAKTVNFGIIYGVSAFGLSNQTDLTRSEAKQLIDTYYETYPTLKDFVAKQIEFAREHGYVETLLGRKRYLKNIHSQNAIVRSADERNAVNTPIQGTAADIIKIAMIRIQERLEKENYQSKMLLQVHDELVFDVFKPEKEKVEKMIQTEMQEAFKISVPLIVDIGEGQNWLEAH